MGTLIRIFFCVVKNLMQKLVRETMKNTTWNILSNYENHMGYKNMCITCVFFVFYKRYFISYSAYFYTLFFSLIFYDTKNPPAMTSKHRTPSKRVRSPPFSARVRGAKNCVFQTWFLWVTWFLWSCCEPQRPRLSGSPRPLRHSLRFSW